MRRPSFPSGGAEVCDEAEQRGTRDRDDHAHHQRLEERKAAITRGCWRVSRFNANWAVSRSAQLTSRIVLGACCEKLSNLPTSRPA